MARHKQPILLLVFMVVVSIFGLFTTFMLMLYPPQPSTTVPWRKPFIGSVFALICILGIIAVFFPRKCAQSFGPLTNEAQMNLVTSNASIMLKGHHPDCKEFSPHVIKVGDMVFCAACAGLLLGAVTALAGAFVYFIVGIDFGQTSLLAVLVGDAGIILGFVQFRFKNFVRLIVNAAFVLSAFLVLVEIDTLAKSFFTDIYVLLLIVFWLLTRIQISKWNNRRICIACQTCEVNKRNGSG